ncbi:MAG: ECF transporter S component [Candidatus Gastranaerophilaceae bacterium]|nr:ECF transporter S component [Christensenellales bacterium]
MMNTITITKKKSTIQNVRMLSMIAMLSAISFVLAFFEFPVPLSPAFARMDLSDLPALIGAFAFGPVAGVMIELVKNALQLITTSTGGVGELANFIIGGAYVFVAGLIYKRRKTKKGAYLSCLSASVAMGVIAAIVNYFILLPMFEMFMPLEQVIASFGAFIPFIKTKLDVVLFNALPFNLLNGIAVSVITMLLYKRLSPILKGGSE